MDPSNSESDEWLMGQVARGKREHLAPLVRRYASPLLTYIQRMTGDRHCSEELFQEVFLAVWSKRKQYKFPKRFRSWLFAIAANQCRADFRNQGRPDAVTTNESAVSVATDSGLTPPETAVAAETATLVEAAVGTLPSQQRTVVVLRIWNAMSYSEIAEVVGCGPATARSYMHHALANMRQYLEPRLRVE